MEQPKKHAPVRQGLADVGLFQVRRAASAGTMKVDVVSQKKNEELGRAHISLKSFAEISTSMSKNSETTVDLDFQFASVDAKGRRRRYLFAGYF